MNTLRFWFRTMDYAPVGPFRWLLLCIATRPNGVFYQGQFFS